MKKRTAKEPTTIEVLCKGVRLLELLAGFPDGLPLHEIARKTRLAKSSAWRLLSTWEQTGYVTRIGAGDYALGLGAIALARKVGQRHRVVELSHGVLARVHRLTQESVYLALYRDGRVVLIDAIESTHALRVVVDLGEQCYLHASAQGRAVAAFLQPEALAEHLRAAGMRRVNERTDTSPEVLAARLAEARELGYAVNLEETVQGAVCVGVPFFAGPDGGVLGSIGLSVPVARVNSETIPRCVQVLREAAAGLDQILAGMGVEPDALSRGSAQLLPVAALEQRPAAVS